MATRREYMNFIMDQLSGLEDITFRLMMGEYIIYLRGKIAAYVCDGKLYVKPVESAKALMPSAPYEPPYGGAKKMLLVEDVDNREFLMELFEAMYDELPEPKPKNKKRGTASRSV